jgi:alpha/beta superfamily hydrolase
MTNKEIHFFIAGQAGKLEAISTAVGSDSRHALVIICHPHPLFGGTMQNKVVTTLARTFDELGLMTMRFNFRGVGQSEGTYDEGRGESQDLLAVIQSAKQHYPDVALWLAGFSFGAYIAAKVATEIEVQQLVTVAPAVEHFPMQTLPPILCPWILVQGELDEVVPPAAVFAWAESRDPQPLIIRLPQATHFFHGQLTELRERLKKELQQS